MPIFYQKNPSFKANYDLSIPDILLGKTHRKVASLEADSLDEAYEKMQGEVWSPNGEKRNLISMLGLHHTSMSVGDVAMCFLPDETKFFQCDQTGWKVVY